MLNKHSQPFKPSSWQWLSSKLFTNTFSPPLRDPEIMTGDPKMEGRFYNNAKDLVRIFCSEQMRMGEPATEAPAPPPPDSATADDVELFAPCIARTFLHRTEGRKPICALCYETPLDLLLPGDPAKDTDIAPIQLPCGHFFGQQCLDSWFRASPLPECPVCKRSLTCDTCGSVKYCRLVYLDTVLLLPKTIPQIREVKNKRKRSSLRKCTNCFPDEGKQKRWEKKLRAAAKCIISEYHRIATASPSLTQQEIEREKQGLEQAAHELSEQVRRFQRFARW